MKEIQIDFIFSVFDIHKANVSIRIITNNDRYNQQLDSLKDFSPSNEISICYDFHCEELQDLKSKKELIYHRLEIQHFNEDTSPKNTFFDYLEKVVLGAIDDKQLFTKLYLKLFDEIKLDNQPTPYNNDDFYYSLDVEHIDYKEEIMLDPYKQDEVKTNISFKKMEIKKEVSYSFERT